MRVSSGILGSLGAALKRGLIGVYEAEITVPPVVQPTMEVRETLRTFYAQGLQVGLQTTSFMLDFGATVTNAVANNSLLCSLDAGVWELDVSVNYSANYVSNQGFALVFGPGGFNIINLLNVGNVLTAGSSIYQARKLKFNLDAKVDLTFVLNANGAGQSHQALFTMLANRLL